MFPSFRNYWMDHGEGKKSKTRAETYRLKRLCAIENAVHDQGHVLVAGVDEAGRGPLAGPIVAAACILPEGYILRGIDDSKKLTLQSRYKFYQDLIVHPDVDYGIGIIEAVEIDLLNIHVATLKAMKEAINRLKNKPSFLLVDGIHLPDCDIPAEGVVDGDQKVQLIAAASIIAKVTRDHIMIGYHELYPQYGFNRHKGYGTYKHLEAIQANGPSPIHRQSFGLLKTQEIAPEEMHE